MAATTATAAATSIAAAALCIFNVEGLLPWWPLSDLFIISRYSECRGSLLVCRQLGQDLHQTLVR